MVYGRLGGSGQLEISGSDVNCLFGYVYQYITGSKNTFIGSQTGKGGVTSYPFSSGGLLMTILVKESFSVTQRR